MFVTLQTITEIAWNLEWDLKSILNWFRIFRIKSLKANPEKFQFIILGRKISDSCVLNIDGKKISSID